MLDSFDNSQTLSSSIFFSFLFFLFLSFWNIGESVEEKEQKSMEKNQCVTVNCEDWGDSPCSQPCDLN